MVVLRGEAQASHRMQARCVTAEQFPPLEVENQLEILGSYLSEGLEGFMAGLYLIAIWWSSCLHVLDGDREQLWGPKGSHWLRRAAEWENSSYSFSCDDHIEYSEPQLNNNNHHHFPRVCCEPGSYWIPSLQPLTSVLHIQNYHSPGSQYMTLLLQSLWSFSSSPFWMEDARSQAITCYMKVTYTSTLHHCVALHDLFWGCSFSPLLPTSHSWSSFKPTPSPASAMRPFPSFSTWGSQLQAHFLALPDGYTGKRG